MLHGYQRPQITIADFLDARGLPIEYGNRWDSQPPEDAYTQVAHPHRFAPVHEVTQALLEWMCARFKVRRYEDPGLARLLRVNDQDLIASVRLFPEDSRCAPMALVFTNFPSVHLEFGALFRRITPNCGCDGCDESVPEMLDELEEWIDAVVSGAFVEIMNWDQQLVTHLFHVKALGFAEESRSFEDISPARLARAREILPHDGRWAPWPVR
ncbi:DUF6226 family protein [Arthrobacter sp. S41]|uniref:DUF6226 family protein n=1 Tax=Arthrobacter sp. S41 TaxID=2509721 RepID=UPI00103648E7|nr:DUF6226 family protein [Arthrobacter sp. S41]TAP27380.1 hypothetical protein EYR88_03205 [Arthrobacter sp. S41]